MKLTGFFIIATEPGYSRGVWRNLPFTGAPLGVTQQLAVIPTGATNGVRSGMEESNQNIIQFIALEIFFDRMNRIFRMINGF